MGVPVRQIQPHRVVLNYTTDRLPLAFLFPSANQSQFNFQETPTPLSITRHVQSEEQVLDVSEEEGWEDENEDEVLGPNSPSMTKESYETEKDELKILIDRELQIVHHLEEQINNSTILEGIYANNKCTLLYQPQILIANTNPDLLSDNPQERVKIMQGLYETIRKSEQEDKPKWPT